MRKLQPQVIHAANLDMLLVGWIYVRCLRRGTTLVYEIADLPQVLYGQAKGIRWIVKAVFSGLERFLCKDISLLVLTSPHYWECHYSRFIPESKYLFVPNAPEKRLFSRFQKHPHKDFVIGFVGMIRYVGQLKMLVDVTRDIQGVRVLIAAQGKESQTVESCVKDLPHVEFLGPYDYEKQILDLYAGIDCVYAVYDTSSDNVRVALPNRLYEAIVCELPTIVSVGTCLADFVVKKGIGFAVSDTDYTELRDLIKSMVSDSSAMGLASIKDDYYAERFLEKLTKAYDKFM